MKLFRVHSRLCIYLHKMKLRTLIAFAATFIPALLRAAEPSYDPLRTGTAGRAVELKFTDSKRTRELPLLVYLPSDSAKAAPVVLFSHGLGGSRSGSAFLGKHWSARGYVAVFLQHPGSDDGVWKDVPAAGRMAKLKAAASLENLTSGGARLIVRMPFFTA